jgi:hypothetical protein
MRSLFYLVVGIAILGTGLSAQAGQVTGKIEASTRVVMPKSPKALFLSARSVKGGPPLAAKKILDFKFPQSFLLDDTNVMIAGTKLEGEIEITARLDQDGDAMTRNPGDVSGKVRTRVGEKGLLLITLETIH